MSKYFWIQFINQLIRGSSRSSFQKSKRKTRLGVEFLEDRTTPTTFTVTSTSGNTTIPVAGSLPYAVANLAALNITAIQFSSSLINAVINLYGTNLPLDLSQAVSIDASAGGTGPGVTLDGLNTYGVFKVDTAVTASISNAIIQDGVASAGAGIDNHGDLSLTDDVITANSATGSGGGIFSDGSLSLLDCTLSGNTAANGGAIFAGNTTSVTNASISGTTISGNSASVSGGAIDFLSSPSATLMTTATLTNDSISYNTAASGGAVYSQASATITDSSLSNNAATSGDGGALWNSGVMSVSASMGAMTLTGNSASGSGGGIFSDGSLKLIDSTVSGNTATTGGGVSNSGTMGIYKSAVSPILSGNLAQDGGAVYNASGKTLTIDDSSIYSNTATSEGGGIMSLGTLTLSGSSVGVSGGNHAKIYGGGIYSSGELRMSASYVDGNQVAGSTHPTSAGGGVYASGSTTLIDSTISENAVNSVRTTTHETGGGIFTSGTTSLINCTISGNTAGTTGSSAHYNQNFGGGIMNTGVLSISRGTISGNSALGKSDYSYPYADPGGNGGGIGNSDTLTMSDTTLSGNSASVSGGGIENQTGGSITISNCTISGNSVTGSSSYTANGGGIANAAVLAISDTTIAANSASDAGGGIEDKASGTITMENSILGGNTGASSSTFDIDENGTHTTDSGYNLLLNTLYGASGIGSNTTHDVFVLTAADLGLASLSNYGGLTDTMALLVDSPALQTALPESTPIATNPTSTDQRGYLRVRGGYQDIGAFESSGFTLSASSGSGQFISPGTPFGNSLYAQLTPNDPNVPVDSVPITFTAGTAAGTSPTGGGSATLGTPNPAVTSSGIASVSATATSDPGTYTVTATAVGPEVNTSAASFTLYNTSNSPSTTNFYWTGAVDNNWSTMGNWSNVVGTPISPPTASDVGDVLIFDDGYAGPYGGFTSNNDIPGLTLYEMEFINSTTGSPFNISGDSITLTNEFTSSGTTSSTIGLTSITLLGAVTFDDDGPVDITSPIDTAGYTMTVEGSATTTNAGVISGSGALVVNGTASPSVILTGSNTYSDGTTLNGGTLEVSNYQGLGSTTGDVTVNNDGLLEFDADLNPAGTVTIGNLTIGGPSGTVTVGAKTTLAVHGLQSFGSFQLLPDLPVTYGNVGGQLTDVGSSLVFEPGSYTQIGTPPDDVYQSTTVDLEGHNIEVLGNDMTGGGATFINNGYIADFSVAGGAGPGVVIADTHSLVKGAGTYYNSPPTMNGGLVQPGNCIGTMTVDNMVVSSTSGTSNFLWQINDANGVAGGQDPDGQDYGDPTSGSSLFQSNTMNWQATAASQVNITVQSVADPDPVGGYGVLAPLTNFNATQKYGWTMFSWTGSYSGPTSDAALNASTNLNTSDFLAQNPAAAGGTFSLHLILGPDGDGGQIELDYTPPS